MPSVKRKNRGGRGPARKSSVTGKESLGPCYHTRDHQERKKRGTADGRAVLQGGRGRRKSQVPFLERRTSTGWLETGHSCERKKGGKKEGKYGPARSVEKERSVSSHAAGGGNYALGGAELPAGS